MTDYSKAFEILFQSPTEPIYTCRDNGKCIFKLPESYYTERDVGVKEMLLERYGDCADKLVFSLKELPSEPDLSFADKLRKNQNFSLFNSLHQEIAGKLIELLLSAEDLDIFLGLCVYTRHRLNPMLFQYCYAVALLHRSDTSGIWVPPVAEIFPSNFVEPSVFRKMRMHIELGIKEKPHVKISRNYTASDREFEQRMAYFREDIGVNMHHWHWHLVYPNSGEEIVKKDRRGELFYYMHQQIIARYNADRFSNNLAKTLPLNNLREPIEEGYFPKLWNNASQRTFPGRITNQQLQDVNRENTMVEIGDLERWCDRILEAIDQGYVVDAKGGQYPLDEVSGIDLLGNIIEESSLSINPQYYGRFHNMGHNLIACAHDPDNRHLEDFGVMGHNTTAMRDPIFYRWHTFINNIFNKFKAILPPYSNEQLSFADIKLRDVEIKTNSLKEPNQLETFWQNSEVDLAAGLDFAGDSGLYASFTHLQHTAFEYQFVAENKSDQMKLGTCRIFLCPQADERGVPLKLEEQRLLAIEMDKFTIRLYPGETKLMRRSVDSSVTIAFERTFGRTTNKDTLSGALAPEISTRLHFCGCGWPHHLLLPKGSTRGMQFDLFFMISDYAGDAVQQRVSERPQCVACETSPNAISDGDEMLCNDDAASYCGLRDKLYPDKRTMGYPFDRRLPAANLNELVEQFDNMLKINVTITHKDEVRPAGGEKKVDK